MKYTIDFDFNKDLIHAVKREVDKRNLIVSNKSNIVLQYLIFLYKKIPVRPRKVHTPKNFDIKRFPVELHQGYKKLLTSIEDGLDLTPFQSRRINQLGTTDDMYFFWNIDHFHLGGKFEKDGFIKRRGELVYAIIRDNDVYILGIYDHNNWSNLDLLRIVKDNWPFLIPNNPITNTSYSLDSAEDIKKLRKYRINSVYTIDDQIIHAPGNILNTMVNSDGTPTYVFLKFNFINNILDNYSDFLQFIKDCKDDIEQLISIKNNMLCSNDEVLLKYRIISKIIDYLNNCGKKEEIHLTVHAVFDENLNLVDFDVTA